MDDRTPTGDLDAADPGHSLRPLGRLHGYQIVEDDPDVRGWAVLGSDGVTVGEVSDLLVDTDAGRVRYLDVAIDTDRLDAPEASASVPGDETAGLPGAPLGTVTAHSAMAGLAPLITESVVRSTLSDEENALTRDQHHGFDSRHVLVPIGHARLDPQHDRVHLEDLTAGQIAELPDYDYGNLDRDTEARLRQYFDRTSGHAPGDDFYASPSFDTDRFYSARRQTGRTQADTARTAGLAEGNESSGGAPARPVTGELDRAGEPVESREVGARRS
jgi:hypothetical protein